jgi:hypothetical protein
MFPVLPVANVANVQLRIGNWNWQHFHMGNILTLATFIVGLIFAPCARAEQPAYTNHAGNVVSGVVVALDARTTTISNATETAALPLSIFPTNEQRRIAADFVLGARGAGQVDLLRVPDEVKRAVSGAEKAIARSRKRAEKGLCTQEESDAFCAESEAALGAYLDKQMQSGTITPAERTALGH